MAHFAISDISNRGFYPAEKFSRQALGLAGASSEPYAVWLDDWYARESNNNSVQLFARTQNTVLDLTLTQTLPPILQGNAGLSVKARNRETRQLLLVSSSRIAGHCQC